MNIKCSELDNISVSFDYFNSIKAVGDEVIKYVRGFNQLSQEYIKKLQLFQTNFAKKLAKSDNPKITQITSLTSKITEIVSQIEELCQVSINDIDSRVKSFEILLKEKQKAQLNEMTNSIKMTKKYEEFHKGSIKASIKKHDKFVEECNSYRDSIKASACEIADEIKTLVCAFMLSLKNNYKQPLCSADIYLNEFNKLNEIEEMDKIITSSFKNDNQFKNFEAAKYQLKSFSRLKNTNYLKDEENNDNDKSNNNQNDNKRKIVEKLEDGFTVMSYICDESLIMTIKTLFENFNLIEKEGFDMKFEEAKNRTQKYILKIISNMNNYPFAKEGTYNENSEEKMQEYLEYKREELSNKEIIDLTELLDTHENRIIFLQKLSDYRARGKFVLCDKDYILLSQLFNIISEKIQKDADYRTAEMVIILSQTYFIEEGTKKIYIQDSFKGNKVFKDKSFWEEFLCYSINKEIMKTLNLDQKMQEDKEKSDYKYSNVVFAQILTLIDNMFEFDLDCETIKDVLNPKISVYKLNDNFKETINDVILAKQEQKNLEMEQINKEKEENKKKEEN